MKRKRKNVLAYLMRVWLKPKLGKLFYWQTHVFEITDPSKEEVYIDIPIETDKREFTERWEEDMVNGFLDGFKGTNMKMVSRIEY